MADPIPPHAAIIVNRDIFTDNSTSSKILVDAVFECFGLEPSCRVLPGKPVAMPCGTFELVMQWSTRFKMDTPHFVSRDVNDHIIDVAGGHTYVEIHPGNFEGSKNPDTGKVQNDSIDCLLPGQSRDTDFVGASRDAYKPLVAKIEAKLAVGRLYIAIVGGGPNV